MLTESVHVPGFVGDKVLPLARLYRYMPVEACNRMVERGEVRVSSSTNFGRDETLSETRRDDEQNKQVSVVLHKLRQKPAVQQGFPFEIQGGEKTPSGTKTTFKSHVDDPFWILSLSTDLTRALFEEFKEPAVVEIMDPEEFINRLRSASAQLLLGPQDIFGHGRAQYGDSIKAYGETVISLSPLLHKADEYRAQKEYRVVWHPRRQARTHEWLYVDGGLADIARVVSREDLANGAQEEVRFPENAVADYQRTHTPTPWEQAVTDSVRSVMEFAERKRREREDEGDRSGG